MDWVLEILQEKLFAALEGMIMLWYGTAETVPAGWHICDGTEGTPDLRDRFVPGAGDHFNPGDTGGGTEHQHDFTGDGHTHNIPEGNQIAAGPHRSGTTDESSATGTTELTNHLPPYHALYYIQKVPS